MPDVERSRVLVLREAYDRQHAMTRQRYETLLTTWTPADQMKLDDARAVLATASPDEATQLVREWIRDQQRRP